MKYNKVSFKRQTYDNDIFFKTYFSKKQVRGSDIEYKIGKI